MAHAITNTKGKNEIAYVGEVPWHGLGQKLTVGSPLEVWAREAGMDWQVQSSPVQYDTNVIEANSVDLVSWNEQQVLWRSDNRAPLGIVSKDYKVVHPKQVLEFFRSLTETNGMTLETAGTLFGGRRYWALARTNHNLVLGGKDVLGGYLLLATSCDGSLATTAKFTSVRVVCNNTLTASLGHGGEAVKVYHSTNFDETKVKIELGVLDGAWDQFSERAKKLASKKLTNKKAVVTLIKAFGDYEKFQKVEKESGLQVAFEQQPRGRAMAEILKLFEGEGRGADLSSAKGTAWGLVNAATQYFDHSAGRIQDRRLANAWFGKNEKRKQDLVEVALSA